MTWTNPKNSRRNIPRGRMADDWRTCTNTLEEGPKSFRSDMNVGDIELNAWSHLCVALFSSQRFFSTVYFPHMCTPTQRRENIYIYIYTRGYSWILVEGEQIRNSNRQQYISTLIVDRWCDNIELARRNVIRKVEVANHWPNRLSTHDSQTVSSLTGQTNLRMRNGPSIIWWMSRLLLCVLSA